MSVTCCQKKLEGKRAVRRLKEEMRRRDTKVRKQTCGSYFRITKRIEKQKSPSSTSRLTGREKTEE